MRVPSAGRVVLVLSASVVAISSAGPLVVRAGVAPELAAFWRTALSAGFLGLFWVGRGWMRRVGLLEEGVVSGGFGSAWAHDRSALAWAVASGILLGLHFWAWFASLGQASIATSTLLVTLSPVWAALVSRWVPGETPLSLRQWGGALVSLAAGGVLVLSSPGAAAGAVVTTPRGVLLALGGGVLAAGYFLASRRARRALDLVPYAMVVNATAASALSGVCVLRGATAWWPGVALGWLVLLALLPQLVGHNGIAWALRYEGTARVSQVVLLEPVGAALLGALWLGMWPGPLEIVCGAFIVMGLMRVMR